jgi:adenylate cyclase class IV
MPREHEEREVKAVVPDPALLRRHVLESGGRSTFRGLMEDRLFDKDGELSSRGEVLRVRTWRPEGGVPTAQLAWKGLTRRSPDGHKVREELESAVAGDGSAAGRLVEALGYRVVQGIDRYVEVFELGTAVIRLEWYPRMDVLVEVEGTPEAIDGAVVASGLSRAAFLPESLPEFVQRFEVRTGERAALSVADLRGDPPAWSRR